MKKIYLLLFILAFLVFACNSNSKQANDTYKLILVVGEAQGSSSEDFLPPALTEIAQPIEVSGKILFCEELKIQRLGVDKPLVVDLKPDCLGCDKSKPITWQNKLKKVIEQMTIGEQLAALQPDNFDYSKELASFTQANKDITLYYTTNGDTYDINGTKVINSLEDLRNKLYTEFKNNKAKSLIVVVNPVVANGELPSDNSTQVFVPDSAIIGKYLPFCSDKQALSEDVIAKIKRLGTYIEIVANQDRPESDKIGAKKLALSLFAHPDQCTIQTQTDKTNTYTATKYFDMLLILPYKKVVIEWYNIAFVEDLQQGNDGNYYGTAIITQKFVGYKGDSKIPDTKTIDKKINVVVEIIKSPNPAQTITCQIRFCDMVISEKAK
jgi:hypothetical protein